VSEYVKFSCECTAIETTRFSGFVELNAYRRRLLPLGLIGIDSNGIGFGNLSIRDGATDNFYVTGSATGGIPELTLADCAKVVAYDFERNWLQYEGSTIPSSESLTHAAIYQSDPKARAVIHCHDPILWATLLDRVPMTSPDAAYGTPELAYEIIRLFNIGDVRNRNIFVMAGHKNGVVTFGKDLEDAFAVLMREREDRIV
jgi:L-ribulose-5-phosphate 4-epimerase